MYCVRCGKESNYLCSACTKFKREYIKEVNACLAAGVPLSSNEIRNRDRDQEDLDIAAKRSATL